MEKLARIIQTDLCHLFTVGFWVERSFCEQHGMFLWSNTKLIVEGVMPDLEIQSSFLLANQTFKNINFQSRSSYLLHVVPVGDDSVFDGIFECEDTSLALCFVADVRVFLTHTNHHSLMPRSTNDGRKDGTRCIVSSETGLAHTGAIVDNKSSNVVISHFFKQKRTQATIQVKLK